MVLQDEILLDLINELATVLNANIAIYGMNPCICTVLPKEGRRTFFYENASGYEPNKESED